MISSAHLRRTRGELRRLGPLFSLALEVRDGRAPYLTAPRGIDALLPGLPRAVVFTKADLAFRPRLDEALARVRPSVAVDARREGARLWAFVRERLPRGESAPRLVVVGLPNVGKSTVINRLAGSARARTGARPGITQGVQWIRTPHLDLLDVPGLLSVPRQPALAALGILPQGSYPPTVVAEELWRRGRNALAAHYGAQAGDLEAFLAAVAARSGLRTRGGGLDLDAAAQRIVVDYQAGRLAPVDWEGAS